MLYDPKWETKTKEPSLAGMIAWLETKDPHEGYDYECKTGYCLIQQYFVSLGRPALSCHTENAPNGRPWYTELTGRQCIALTRPHTFGAALKRARKALVTEQ